MDQRQWAAHQQQVLAQQRQAILSEVEQRYASRINGLSAHARGLEAKLNAVRGEQAQKLDALLSIASQTNLSITTLGAPERAAGVLRVEDIPGTRIPYTALVRIPIGSDQTALAPQSYTVTQEGIFVATRRLAGFLSLHELEVINNLTATTSNFPGRSHGRWRPIHSAGDVLDAGSPQATSDGAAWFLANDALSVAGDVLPGATLVQPTNMSGFRTMEFDGTVSLEVAGSQFPRQNIPVPTMMYTEGATNGPFDLAALDVFERGSVLTWQVQPTHPNNPSFGNVDNACVFPRLAAIANFADGYPFLAGQFDSHEGVCTPGAITRGDAAGEWTSITADVVSRATNGIFYVGLEGYRIVQTIAPVP